MEVSSCSGSNSVRGIGAHLLQESARDRWRSARISFRQTIYAARALRTLRTPILPQSRLTFPLTGPSSRSLSSGGYQQPHRHSLCVSRWSARYPLPTSSWWLSGSHSGSIPSQASQKPGKSLPQTLTHGSCCVPLLSTEADESLVMLR